MKPALEKYFHRIDSAETIKVEGKVTKVVGTIIEGNGPAMPVEQIDLVSPLDGLNVLADRRL